MIKKKLALALDHTDFEFFESEVKKEIGKPAKKDKVIFCDFDGTITIEDIVDKLFSKYADEYWKEIEKLWEQAKIGSERCLRLQLDCIKHITEDELIRFTLNIAIDPHFSEFVRSIKEDGTDLYIVSDGFDCLIELVLKNHNITDIPTFANRLRIQNNKPVPSFPFKSNQCYSGSGMCKCAVINKYREDRSVVYIGDGISDICAVRNADMVFAKSKLSNYCIENCIDFFQFSHFGDILNIFFKKEQKDVI